jgi:hypothetical protein
VVERVAAVAALGDDSASWEAEALNALNDIVGHGAEHRRSLLLVATGGNVMVMSPATPAGTLAAQA